MDDRRESRTEFVSARFSSRHAIALAGAQCTRGNFATQHLKRNTRRIGPIDGIGAWLLPFGRPAWGCGPLAAGAGAPLSEYLRAPINVFEARTENNGLDGRQAPTSGRRGFTCRWSLRSLTAAYNASAPAPYDSLSENM